MDKTIYTVSVNGNDVGDYDRLTDAIRDWDASTFKMDRAFGHIRVVSWVEGLVVRDGYILRVDEESGRVYLNPGLTDSPEVPKVLERKRVEFFWSTKYGSCTECGLPAAYDVHCYGEGDDPGRMCSVCAASHAAAGSKIDWLFEEDR